MLLRCCVAVLLCYYVAMLVCCCCYVVMLRCCYVAVLLCCYVTILLCCYVAMLLSCYVAKLLCSMRKGSNTGKKKLKFVQKRPRSSFHDEYSIIRNMSWYNLRQNSLPTQTSSMKSGGRQLHEFWITIQDGVDSSIPGFRLFTSCKKKPCINLTRSAVSPTAEPKKVSNSSGDQNNSFQSSHSSIKVRRRTWTNT
jgi:hypothetical protein